jgi:anti-sigma factor RsiW
MNCPEWEERIALYGGGDLPPNEMAETDRHLAQCAPCREFAQGVNWSLAIVRSAHSEPIPPAAFTALRARVLEQLARERRPPWRLAWIVPLVAAAVLTVTLVLPRRVAPIRTAVTPPPAPLFEPVAPATEEPITPKRPPRARRLPKPRAPAEPLMVKLITDDPDVVIYWIPN